ncbi:tRNA 2-thiouridine(34) synthase MnmA [Candidatus Giovannonibacteria bacterium RIFCSPHIGHO2_01_FULL_45_33]|uniref:tRNA-specific 2-thiouridylase MnmA n=1 Tax=Candidatus Giovannonibacteria bacterium RIFCSPLOWO2_01_FULL_45_34 TaxID=1798351 RepID=A0A1F5X0F6_9BACT|nr:MAG: tRNA 2-thiouridine(34) synthase MnmA [Candidatus Giovannonibacteria bacterium RIFCSPHIGHO2_01_FULL_45_33]OGF70211.1 MAG: tRNA 2-thiouridine(34) synthase MnmA [Candidatus Giovannonibacteria bacterium RIFCSPHIGHO2_02_FULL_44_11]OGF81375.1 MAG: tRNA 2-thiouridine(34) synthase MnmA [Candidatus Giovannonibacteria bacterium RIFCSPLOWO2_01_FULL_45_34]
MSNINKKVYPERSRMVLVAMSGGVDSSVAAALLKEEGYEVHGAHMLCWDGCENNGDKQDAMSVAARLEIPFYTFDFRKEYKKSVYEYMVREYKAGRTPNPDVMCNKTIKFGIFLDRALAMGFDFIATGHYVRREQATHSGGPPQRDRREAEGFLSREKPVSSGVCGLREAHDKSKDQSYFLWTLTQDQLKHSLFPVGNYLKSEVREIAKKFGLPNAAKKDSQGLCFVGKVDFAEFIREALPKNPGIVVDSTGKKIGEHDGAHFYTLGQRHGLNIGGTAEPLYIAEKQAKTNTLVVARGNSDPILFKKELCAENVHWIAEPPAKYPLAVLARIRYRQPLQKCVLQSDYSVIFDNPQKAVTPGQSVVFYVPSEALTKEGLQMLGGAIIK